MPDRFRLAFYISGHGFGHAARALQVVNAVVRLQPSARIIIRTSVPEWFLRASLDVPADIVPTDVDTGVVQFDSLSIDETETARRAAEFHATFDERVAREADVIRAAGVALVIGDVPPLAFAAARAAGVPSVAISNFTWDWIYGGFPEFDRRAPGVRAQIQQANAAATLALRLPFPGGFETMPRVQDIPLVARKARSARAATRARLQIADGRPVVLATFGGHGGNIPLVSAATSSDAFHLVATDYEVSPHVPATPNLRVVSAAELSRAGLTYTDLLAASDVVATKPGYGIVSECIANQVAMLYTLRGRFIEQDVFIREMPAVLRCREIDREDLLAGNWAAAVEALCRQPPPRSTMESNGDEVAAERIVQVLGSRRF